MTMTIEIKQLIIRAVVDGRSERPAGTSGARGRVGSEPVHHAVPPDIAVNRETMIAECTRHVLRELQRGRGR
jgi:hypothetical protein